LVSFGRLTVFAIDGKDGSVARGVGSTRRRRKELAPLQEKPVQRPLKRVAYRPREVAEMVGMSESGVRNLIRRGTLRAVQLDGRWLVPAAVIEDKLGIQLDASPPPDTAPQVARTSA
jgi:excisionase family DNA binding protein